LCRRFLLFFWDQWLALAFAFSAALYLGDDLVHFSSGEGPAGGCVDIAIEESP